MHSKLLEIVSYKIEQIKTLKPLEIKREKKILNVVRSLSEKPFIAEFKKGSPSAGIINDKVDIVYQVKEYEKYGAGMVSVLTDDRYFSGSFENLAIASKNLTIPTLCKEFIISEIQIDYAFQHGADAILLIAAILKDEELQRLSKYGKKLGLSILMEIHTLEEYERIKGIEVDMIGVNSRNLNNFEIDKVAAAKLIKQIDSNRFIVAESGIDSADDVAAFKRSGADAFLVGTFLMKNNNLKEAFDKLYQGLHNVC